MSADRAPQYLKESQESKMTGLAVQTLRNDRAHTRRIPYIKIGRAVRYSLHDVVGFMETHRIAVSTRTPGDISPQKE
jgi:hypothetical protein